MCNIHTNIYILLRVSLSEIKKVCRVDRRDDCEWIMENGDHEVEDHSLLKIRRQT